jgi:hypothetical protein
MNYSLVPVLLVYLFLATGTVIAQEKDARFWHAEQSRIYGEELLSPEERQQYRQKLWELKTEAERERFRDTYRQMVDERARTLGVPSDDNRRGEKQRKGEKEWPDDGLRRWPEARSPKDGLRHWNDKPAFAAKENGKELSRRWLTTGAESQAKGSDPEEEKP